MKNKLFFLLLIATLSFSVSAQEKEENPFKNIQANFGVKGGLNFFSGQNKSSDSELWTGFYAGLFGEFRLSEKWSLQPELLYTEQYGHHFLEVPVQIKYYITSKLSVMAGPKVDFLLDQSRDQERLRPVGISATVGAQYDFSKRFFVHSSYSLGSTTQIIDDNPDNSSGTFNSFKFGLGFKF